MDKRQLEKQEKLLAQLAAVDESNKFCADCGQKGTRWASWNIGVFLCIQCCAMHRKMGPNISKVKSTSLDIWSDEQLTWFQQRGGNACVNAQYLEALSAERRAALAAAAAADDATREQHIRDKYERKLFMHAAGRTAATTAERDVRSAVQHREQASLAGIYSLEMERLCEMGFADETCNAALLRETSGDVAKCIEKLLRTPAATGQQQEAQPRASERALLSQLRLMGFGDDSLNVRVLRRCDGRLGETVERLVAMRDASSPAAKQRVLTAAVSEGGGIPHKKPSNSLFQSGGGGMQAHKKATLNADLIDAHDENWQEFSGAATKSTASDDILSLFDVFPAAAAPNTAASPQSAADELSAVFNDFSFATASASTLAAKQRDEETPIQTPLSIAEEPLGSQQDDDFEDFAAAPHENPQSNARSNISSESNNSLSSNTTNQSASSHTNILFDGFDTKVFVGGLHTAASHNPWAR